MRRIELPFESILRYVFIAMAVLLPLSAVMALPTGLQEFYVLGWEPHVYAVFNDVDQKNDPESFEHGRMSSVISFTVAADGQVVIYDHWENGYEPDALNPVQTTGAARTEIWGDGNAANGIAPGDDGDDLLVAGQAVVCRSDRNDLTINGYVRVNVAAPHDRDPSEVRFDGGDRLVTAGGAINVIHASWPQEDTYIGGAFEIPAVELYRRKYSYTVPVGLGGFVDFAYVYLLVQATADNTSVIVNNGSADPLEVILNQGESLLVSDDADASYDASGPIPPLTGGITQGTVVSASAPVQAGLVTGAPGRYQTRFFLLLPDPLFSPDYHVPYPSQPGADSEIYLFNPNPDPIVVTAWDNQPASPYSIAIAAGGAVSYSGSTGHHVPAGSGVRLSSDDVFWGVGSGDSGDTTNDWGYSLIPDLFVRDDVTTSWSPGTLNLSGDGSPIWVTPLADDTTFWVDVDGDGVADDVDVDGDDAPETGPYTIDALQSLRFHDWRDDDNSGMRIWADNPFTALWGPDATVSPASYPGIDWGNSILPPDRNFLNPSLDLVTVAEPTRVDPDGGTVHKTLYLSCGPVGPVTDVDLSDLLPGPGWSYVPASAVLTYPNGYQVSLEPEPLDGGRRLFWNLSNELGAFESLRIDFDIAFAPTTGISFVAEDWEAGRRYDGGTEALSGDWIGSWQEENDDGSAASGVVRVQTGSARSGTWGLNFRGNGDPDPYLWREVDLSGFVQPVFEFWFRGSSGLDIGDDVWIQVSGDGGSSWSELENFDEWDRTLFDDGEWRRWRFDLTPWKAANTRIRFRHDITRSDELVDLDDLRIFDARAVWDDFEAGRVYDGGTGWSGPWIETDDGGSPTGGSIEIVESDNENDSDRLLRFDGDAPGGVSIERSADLSAFTTPVISFHWKAESLEDEEVVEVLLSDDGGNTWTSVASFDGWSSGGSPDDNHWRLFTFDASAYATSGFRLRLRHNIRDNGDVFWIDNVWIAEERLRPATEQVYVNTGRATGSYQGYPLVSQDGARIVTGRVDISKTVDVSTAEVGDVLTYTILVENVGPTAVTAVRVTDLLPPNTTYVSSAGAPGVTPVYSGASNTVTWTWAAPLAPGAPVSLGLQVRVKKVPFDPTAVRNQARVHTAEGAYNETNPAETLVRIPVLEITAFGPGTATPGAVIDYELRLENVGSASASGARIQMAIPEGTTYVAGSATGGPEYSDDEGATWSSTPGAIVTHLRWIGLDVAPGATETPRFSVTHDQSAVPPVGRVYGWASISSDQTIPARSNVVVTNIGPLLIDKTANRSIVGPGFLIDYALRLRASGASESGVVVSEPIPRGTWYQPGSATAGSADLLEYSTDLGQSWTTSDPSLPIVPDAPVFVTNLRWTWSVLPDGSDETVAFRTRVDNPLLAATVINNQARVQSSTRGPLLSNLVRIPTVDLTLAHTASRDSAQVGDRIDYRLYYGNQGSSLATSTVVTMAIPAFTTLMSGSVTGAPYTVTGGVIRWDVGDLPAPTAPTELGFSVTVDPGTPEGTLIESSAWARNAIDQQPSDVVSVLVASSNVILGIDGERYGDQLDTLVYPLTVTNTGAAPDSYAFELAPDSWPGASVRVYRDVDGDRRFDPGLDEEIEATVSLAAGAELRLVATVTIPETANDGDVHSTFVTARSLGSPTVHSAVELVSNVLTLTHVTLVGLRARSVPGGSLVEWETGSEVRSAGFRIHRSVDPSGPPELLPASFVPARGGVVRGASYSLLDPTGPSEGHRFYWLEEVDLAGRGRFYGPVELDGAAFEELAPTGRPVRDDPASTPRVEIRPGGLDGLRIVAESDGFIDFEYVAPRVSWHLRTVGADRFVEPRLDGGFHGKLKTSGWPGLPVCGFLFDRPGRRVEAIRVLDETTEIVEPGLPVLPAPFLERRDDGAKTTHVVAPETETFRGRYPERSVELALSPSGKGDAFRLRICPMRWHGPRGKLELLRRIQFRVSLTPTEAREVASAAAVVSSGAGRRLRVSVASAGWIRLGWHDLVAGEPALAAADPRRFRLLRRGVEVPLFVTGEDDGTFDDGDVVSFYAEGHEDLYDDHDVFFLDWEAASPLRIRTAPVGTGVLTPVSRDWVRQATVVDPDDFYWAEVPGADDRNRWYADLRVDSLTGPVTTTFAADGIVDSTGEPATLWVELQPMVSQEAVNPDHSVRLVLNGHELARATWDGDEARFVGAPLPVEWLQEGENELQVEVLLADGVFYDRLLVNRLFLTHPKRLSPRDGTLCFEADPGAWTFVVGPFDGASVRLLDVTSSGDPVMLEGAEAEEAGGTWSLRFSTESTSSRDFLLADEGEPGTTAIIEPVQIKDWASSPPAADLVVVAPRDFHEPLAPLVARRRAEGLRVLVTTPRELYDEFAHGVVSPRSLRDGLAGLWRSIDGSPLRYVLFVGDASFDFKDNRRSGFRPLVPTYTTQTPGLGQAASDAYFGDLDGDGLPDVAVGRWPFREAAAVSAMVDRVLAYEDGVSTDESWRLRVVGVSGDGEPLFAQESDDLLGALPSALSTVPVDRIDFSTAGETRAAIAESLDAGCLLFHYLGHGQIDLWGNEDLLPSSRIASLTNGIRMPVVLSATCLDGYFIDTTESPCRADTFLSPLAGGAIAVWSSSSLASAEGKEPLLRAFYAQLFDRGTAVLGDCVRGAQVAMLLDEDDEERVVATHVLFGDPSMRIRVPAPDSPRAFSAERVSTRSVRLSWEAASTGPDAVGFRLERQDSAGGAWVIVSTTPITETSALVEVDSGSTVAYRVRSLGVLENFPSAPSDSLTVSLPAEVGIHGGGGCAMSDGGGSSPLDLLAGLLLLGSLCLRGFGLRCGRGAESRLVRRER